MIIYIFRCELFLPKKNAIANNVDSMTALKTAPMAPPPTHDSGEHDVALVTGLSSSVAATR